MEFLFMEVSVIPEWEPIVSKPDVKLVIVLMLVVDPRWTIVLDTLVTLSCADLSFTADLLMKLCELCVASASSVQDYYWMTKFPKIATH